MAVSPATTPPMASTVFGVVNNPNSPVAAFAFCNCFDTSTNLAPIVPIKPSVLATIVPTPAILVNDAPKSVFTNCNAACPASRNPDTNSFDNTRLEKSSNSAFTA